MLASLFSLVLFLAGCPAWTPASAADSSLPQGSSFAPTIAGGAGSTLPALLGPSPGGIYEATLANGLKVLLKEAHSAPILCCSVWYRAGSRNESAGQTGLSHLLEHMMFKGTARHGKGEFDRLLESNGARNNATTWLDRTQYFILIAAEKADLAMDLEADRMRGALFTQADLDDERTVVQNEMEKSEDDPWSEMDDRIQSLAILEHPYHWPVLGWKSDVEAITDVQIRAYYDRLYQPNNAYLVLVGDLPVRSMLEKAVLHFGAIPRGPDSSPVVTVEPPQRGERRFLLREAGRTRILGMAYQVPGRRHHDGYALDLLGLILGQGRTSRLYRAVVETGLAASARARNGGEMRDPFLFFIWTELAEGASPDSLERAIDREIDRLRREPPSAAEVQRAFQQKRVEVLFSRDDLPSLMFAIGEAESSAGYDYYDHYLDSLAAVTPADIQRVVSRYLNPESRTIGFYLPGGADGGSWTRGAPAVGDRRAWRRYSRGGEADAAAADGPQSPESPRTLRVELPNGIVLLLRESRDNPTVELRGSLDGGLSLEPGGKEGVANLVALTFPLGTERRSAAELADALESKGIEISFDAGPDEISVRARALSEELPALVELLSEMLVRPAFPPDQIEVAREQARSSLGQARSDTYSLVRHRALEGLYGPGSPWGRWVEGTDSTLAALRREDLVAFHQEIRQARRWTFAVVGDARAEQVRGLFSRYLGQVSPGEEAVHPNVAALRPATGASARSERAGGASGTLAQPLRIPVADKSQVDLMFAGSGVRPGDPGYPAAYLADVGIGGSFTSRLQSRLRGTDGLTYDASSEMVDFHGASCWLVALGVNPANVEQAVAGVGRELDSVRRAGFTEQELSQAREFAAGSYPIHIRNKGRLAEALLWAERFGLGPDYVDTFAARLRAVPPDDVRKAVARLVDPAGMVGVMAGTFAPDGNSPPSK